MLGARAGQQDEHDRQYIPGAHGRVGDAAMTALPAAVRLRPLTLGDLLDEPFALLRDNLRTILLVTGVVVVPLQLVGAYLQREAFGSLGFFDLVNDPVAAQVALESGDRASMLAIGLQLAAAASVMPFVAGVVCLVAVSALLGERLGPLEALRATLRRWPALVGAWLLAAAATFGLAVVAMGLIVAGGMALGMLGGMLLLAAVPVGLAAHALFTPAAAVVVVERRGPFAALRRSVALVRPRLLPVLGAVVLAGLVASLVQGALSALPSMIAMVVGLDAGWILLGAGAIAAGLVVTPYGALVSALVYADGRVRQEAWDLEVVADAAPAGAGGR